MGTASSTHLRARRNYHIHGKISIMTPHWRASSVSGLLYLRFVWIIQGFGAHKVPIWLQRGTHYAQISSHTIHFKGACSGSTSRIISSSTASTIHVIIILSIYEQFQPDRRTTVTRTPPPVRSAVLPTLVLLKSKSMHYYNTLMIQLNPPN